MPPESISALKARLTACGRRDNPRAPAWLRRRRYYHGSQDPYAMSILKTGAVLPRSESGVLAEDGSWLSPVPGRVYVSPDPMRAAQYLELTRTGRHSVGLIVEIDGRNLVDVDPDEDDVGRAVHTVLTAETTSHPEFEEAVREKAWRPKIRRDGIPGLEPTAWGDRLRAIAEQSLTATQLHQMGEWSTPGIAMIAKVGKKVLAGLDDDLRLDLMKMGSDISHVGPLSFMRAYVCRVEDVDRARSWSHLRRDCVEIHSPREYQDARRLLR